MLILIFKVRDNTFALPCGDVVECVPGITPRPLPRAPGYVPGVIGYRGMIVPVVDLSMLIAGAPSPPMYSTRLILVRYPLDDVRRPYLALLAEEVVSYSEFDPGSAARYDGMSLPDAKFLGTLYRYRGAVLQFIKVPDLIPPDARDILFAGYTDDHDRAPQPVDSGDPEI